VLGCRNKYSSVNIYCGRKVQFKFNGIYLPQCWWAQQFVVCIFFLHPIFLNLHPTQFLISKNILYSENENLELKIYPEQIIVL